MSRTSSLARPRSWSPCAALGVALAATMLAAAFEAERLEDAAPAPTVITEARACDQPSPVIAEDILHGLWMRYETRGEGDPLRFWYFHGDGKGLYRYGKVGLANTHSFDYDIEGAEMYLRLRKSGAEHIIDVQVEHDDQGRAWLTLVNDPFEPGARYFRVDSDLDALEQVPGPVVQAPGPAAQVPAIGDRLWIDYRQFATGGAEFHMYQLAATAIDGRGVGWFHRGDFDDWSTESLTYRIDGDRLELFFDLREEPNVTAFRLVDGAHGRELVLDADPRDYWATHHYRDGGRSFGAGQDVAAMLALESAVDDL